MRTVGFDSKVIKRPKRNFKALLGVGVTVNDYEKFCKSYDEIIKRSCSSWSIARSKRTYKSSDLVEFSYRIGSNTIDIIAKELLKIIDFIDVYYTYFEPEFPEISDASKIKPVELIGCYYMQEIERISPIKFIDLISGPYPALCCYAYLQTKTVPILSNYYLDHCPGIQASKAITKVLQTGNVFFLFKGDQINPVISAADILCRYIDDNCLRYGHAINKHVPRLLNFDSNKVQTTFIGSAWLWAIKPSHREQLNISHKLLHPIYYFFNAPNEESIFGKKARDTLEKSNIFSSALDKASHTVGSVKFFQSEDQPHITKQDFLVVHDDYSDKMADNLNRMGCPAQKINIEFFK